MEMVLEGLRDYFNNRKPIVAEFRKIHDEYKNCQLDEREERVLLGIIERYALKLWQTTKGDYHKVEGDDLQYMKTCLEGIRIKEQRSAQGEGGSNKTMTFCHE